MIIYFAHRTLSFMNSENAVMCHEHVCNVNEFIELFSASDSNPNILFDRF